MRDKQLLKQNSLIKKKTLKKEIFITMYGREVIFKGNN